MSSTEVKPYSRDTRITQTVTDRWSYSAYNEYMLCGHRYFLKRVKETPTVPWVSAVAGTAFHSWTEGYDHYLLERTGGMTAGDFQYEWDEELDRAVLEEEEQSGVPPTEWKVSGRLSKDKPNREDLDWWAHAGWEMCEQYMDWRLGVDTRIATDLPPDENGNTIGIEYALNVELIGKPFVAYLDRVEYDSNGNLGVRDLKTGRLRTSVQPGFYSGAARLVGLYLHWWDRYDARKGVTVPNPPKPLDEWSASRVAHLLAQAEDQRSRGIYPVRIGEHCGFCPVRDACEYKM